MATQVQNRRGTTAEHSTFTGAVGEVTIDTDKDTVVVHDGSTAGGRPLLREDLSNLPAGAIDNADINASAAIAGTKISPNFGSQNIVTTGNLTVDTNTLFVDATNNRVGIGTTSPALSLQVTGTVGTTPAASNSGFLLLSGNSGAASGCTIESSFTSGGYGPLVFNTSGSERARIDSSGRLGVGTSSPNQLLDVRGNSNPQLKISETNNSTSAGIYIENQGQRNWQIWANRATDTLSFGTNDRANTFLAVDGATGRVGIGTTSPAFSTGSGLEIEQDSASATLRLQRVNTGGSILEIRADDGKTVIDSRQVSTDLVFQTNSTERARIDSSGRLLVGTSSAITGSNSIVDGTQFVNTGATIGAFANNAFSFRLQFAKSRNATPGSHTIVQNADALGYLDWAGSDGTNFIIGARITGEVDGTPGTNDMPGRLVFSTTADGASNPTERMRIRADGATCMSFDFFAGGDFTKASIQNGTVSGKMIDVTAGASQLLSSRNSTTSVNHVVFFNPNGAVGTIATSASATSYNTSSDYRLKENVTPVTDGITRLQQLKPSRFNFIADPDKTVDGFIAHEVQTIVPEAITGEKDAVDDEGNPQYQGIDQSKLVPLLTAALQEAVAKIESLEARLTAAGI